MAYKTETKQNSLSVSANPIIFSSLTQFLKNQNNTYSIYTNIARWNVASLWLLKVMMDLHSTTYDPDLEFQQLPSPWGHMIMFWVLGNQPIFMAICSISQSHDHKLQCFLLESSTDFQFLAKKKKKPTGKMDLPNDLGVHLMAMGVSLDATKVAIKSSMVSHITGITYNLILGSYGWGLCYTEVKLTMLLIEEEEELSHNSKITARGWLWNELWTVHIEALNQANAEK